MVGCSAPTAVMVGEMQFQLPFVGARTAIRLAVDSHCGMGLKREVAVQTGAWALFSACSIIGALNTDGWFSGVFWLAAIVLGGLAIYGALLLYRSRGMDLNG